MQVVQGLTHTVEVTPTVSASSAYTAEDQVGGIMTIEGACQKMNSNSSLISLIVTDKAKQSAALTVFFFDELPTVASSDNAAIDITDAEMLDKCVGHVTVAASDYQSVSGSSVACLGAAGTKAPSFKSKTSGGKLYAVVKTTGTPTYGATGDLSFKFTFAQDA